MWCLAAVVLAVLAVAAAEISQATRDAVDERLETLETSMYTVARQLMLQRLAMEESIRSDGNSGVKQVRINRDGNRPYMSATHVSNSALSIHDHTELKRTCGMGEFEAVLNGVHFRTRHNDYQLVKPSTTSGDFNAVEEIEFPPVPPEILNQTDWDEAARTMRAYFRAWQEGDDSVLDYKPYFRPVLCYLEGAWTNDVDLDEPFDSERHHLDALSWFDLQEKARFTAYTGDKDEAENYAYLPTAIVNVTDGQPVLAQWNYRILCNPVQGDLLELEHLRPVDELHAHMGSRKNLEDHLKTRKGRFMVSDKTGDTTYAYGKSLLDKLMRQIPGKDNFMADIEDTNLNMEKYDIVDTEQKLNAGFYHRFVHTKEKDAMGVTANKRGFAERDLYFAMTTQSRVVPLDLNDCNRWGNDCEYSFARYSYAVPLEVVWTTPLNTWNPFSLPYRGLHRSEEGQTVVADGRDGGFDASDAFNGTNSKNYFLTPAQFFTGGEMETDAADTVPGSVGVLDSWNNVRSVKASGVRIFLPQIVDVGSVRTRYPVFPVHAEGNTAFKEVEALSKIVLDLSANAKYLHAVPEFGSGNVTEVDATRPDPALLWFKMQTAESNMPNRGTHIHYVDLRTKHALFARDGCETYQVRTSLSKYHTHLMTIHFNVTANQWEYVDCDGSPSCRDNHGVTLTPLQL